MNLFQLYYFKRLAELQHYKKTATELYITQPSLSVAISSLEKELGVPLFQKEGRNVKLTKNGLIFYQYVSSSLAELERGIAYIQEKSGKISGTIDVACIPTLLDEFLPEAIKECQEINPNIHFNIYQGMSLEIIEGLLNSKYDIGFCSKTEHIEGLAFVPILTQELVALVCDSHELAAYDAVSLDDLAQYPILTYRKELPVGELIKNRLDSKNIKAAHIFDDEISIGGFTSKNNAVSLALNTSYLKMFDHLKKIPIIDIPKDFRIVYMVYNKKIFVTSAIESFTNFIVANKLDLKK